MCVWRGRYLDAFFLFCLFGEYGGSFNSLDVCACVHSVFICVLYLCFKVLQLSVVGFLVNV